MTNNICMIIDNSEAYLRTKSEEIFKEWGFDRNSVKEISNWKDTPASMSLFDERLMTILNLSNKNDLKSFSDLITNKKTKERFDNKQYWGNGLIIITTHATGIKKIEENIKKNNGSVFKKEKANKRKDELLSELSIPVDTKKFVANYAGEDYDLLLSFYNEINKLPKNEQKNISIEKAYSFFPPILGSVLPWEFLNELMNGHTGESINTFRRTIKNTHILVPMVFLQKKMALLLRYRYAMIDKIPNNKIAEAIGEKNGPEIWSISKVAQRITPATAEQIALITTKLESDLKGGSSVDSNQQFISTLAQIGLLLNNKD